MDFYKFFTGVETSSFGNFKPNGIRTSPSGFWSPIGIFFHIGKILNLSGCLYYIPLGITFTPIGNEISVWFFLLKPQMLFYFSFRDKLIINISPFGIIIILYLGTKKWYTIWNINEFMRCKIAISVLLTIFFTVS